MKKKSSCLGIFVKIFFFMTLALGVITALGVVVSIYFFEVDAALWTDYKTWNAYPYITTAIVLLVSGMMSAGLAVFGVVVTSLLTKGEAKGDPRLKPARKKRPQSNRKTTL